MLQDELSKLLKKAYKMDRQAAKAADNAAEQPKTKKKGKAANKAKKEQPEKARTAEKPDERS